MVDQDNIKKVLALFDEEDLPYIRLDFVSKILLEDPTFYNPEPAKEKCKTKGGKNDRPRK